MSKQSKSSNEAEGLFAHRSSEFPPGPVLTSQRSYLQAGIPERRLTFEVGNLVGADQIETVMLPPTPIIGPRCTWLPESLPAALRKIREALKAIEAEQATPEESAWRKLVDLAGDDLWAAVKEMEDDSYRHYLADQLRTAVAMLDPEDLTAGHLAAVRMSLDFLGEPGPRSEEELDRCEDAWRRLGINTTFSLGELTQDYLSLLREEDEETPRIASS